MRTRIKICGITRLEDALAAVSLGVDALGFVFVARSPRAVTPAQACEILRALPPFVTTVGLFLDAPVDEVREVLDQVPLDLLQFHGDERPADCTVHGRPYIKAVAMGEDTDVAAYAGAYADAAGLLLDSHRPGGMGGSGERFDWSRFPRDLQRPLILAGGLTPQNVGAALRATRAYAVDVSSGVEVRPGIKDPGRMQAFVEEVRRVDNE